MGQTVVKNRARKISKDTGNDVMIVEVSKNGVSLWSFITEVPGRRGRWPVSQELLLREALETNGREIGIDWIITEDKQQAKAKDKTDHDIEITGGKDKTVSVDMPVSEENKLTPKEQKKYLLEQIDAAIKVAPEGVAYFPDKDTIDNDRDSSRRKADAVFAARTLESGTVTIEVPGDGEFTVLNTQPALRQFKTKAAQFPHSMLANKKKTPLPTTEQTGRRVLDFAGEYFTKYSPKAAPDFLEGVRGLYYEDGWFSNRAYMLKMPKPKTNAPLQPMPWDSVKGLLKTKKSNLFHAELGIEYYVNPTGDKDS
jgi:hypothetical protein